MRRRIPISIFVAVVLVASTLYSPQAHASSLQNISATGASLWQEYTAAVNPSLWSVTGSIARLLSSKDEHAATTVVGESNITTPHIAHLSTGDSVPQPSTTTNVINNYYTLASSSPAITVSPKVGVSEAELTDKLAELEAHITNRPSVYSDTSTKTYGPVS